MLEPHSISNTKPATLRFVTEQVANAADPYHPKVIPQMQNVEIGRARQ